MKRHLVLQLVFFLFSFRYTNGYGNKRLKRVMKPLREGAATRLPVCYVTGGK